MTKLVELKSRFQSRVFLALMPLALLFASPSAALAIEINENFKPQNEFKLDPWVNINIGPVDVSINKAVFLLVLASIMTIGTLLWISRTMRANPTGRVQTAVELAYGLTLNTLTRGNMNEKMARRWFPFIASLFFFIWFSNMLGFLPLPTNTEHKIDFLGVQWPAFALYAATANLSVPLALALVVWIAYNVEGVREHGPVKYVKSWIPAGIPPAARVPIFFIEALSHFVRLISLSARLFANMLAGHMLILIMGGGMVVLLGMAVVGIVTVPIAVAFYLFELLLIASLQAFIFAILSAIYLGGAVAHEH